jgi:integrase
MKAPQTVTATKPDKKKRITDATFANAKPQDKPYKLMAGRGLQLRVGTTGDKTWLVRYVVEGNERQYRLPEEYGSGPGLCSWKDAQARATEIQALGRAGTDYQKQIEESREALEIERQRVKAQSVTVSELFETWLAHISVKHGGIKGRRGRIDGGKEARRALEKDVMPDIGGNRLTDLKKADVLKVIKKVSARGHNRLAVMLLRDVKQMLRWAEGEEDLKPLLAHCTALSITDEQVIHGNQYDPVRRRVLAIDEIKLMRDALPAADLTEVVQAAIWVMLGCGTRVGETVAARWAHVDIDARTWSIPKENTKTQTAITIHLSDFVLRQFLKLRAARDARDEEERSDWVFPSRTSPAKPLDNQTVGKALADRQRLDGKAITGRTTSIYGLVLLTSQELEKRLKEAAEDTIRKKEAVPLRYDTWKCHDLRRTAATEMQRAGIAPEIVHRCLNHAPASKLDDTYMRYDYTNEMIKAWAALGAALDTHLGFNVIPVDFRQQA